MKQNVGQNNFLKYTLNYDFKTVLDIGTGSNIEAIKFFINNGKIVHALDIACNIDFKHEHFYTIEDEFLAHPFTEQFDAVWASHILEHFQNTGLFLDKVYDVLNSNGIFFCIVPPHKTEIVGGHVTIGWNIGILMYNLILSGFDVRNGRFKKMGYNIAAFVRKRKGTRELPKLTHDFGDINRLADYFPRGFNERFEGDMEEWNWFEGNTT